MGSSGQQEPRWTAGWIGNRAGFASKILPHKLVFLCFQVTQWEICLPGTHRLEIPSHSNAKISEKSSDSTWVRCPPPPEQYRSYSSPGTCLWIKEWKEAVSDPTSVRCPHSQGQLWPLYSSWKFIRNPPLWIKAMKKGVVLSWDILIEVPRRTIDST